ncbi:MAG: response regulator [Desulforhopalus sp.]
MTGKASVLVVDDDTTMREILDFYLQRQGLVVSIAENGRRAIQLIQANQYDLVITDMEMGSVNGLEVVRFAKTYRPDIFVIMITGNYEVGLRKDAFRLGVDDFLYKPFDLASLFRRLPDHFLESTKKFDK